MTGKRVVFFDALGTLVDLEPPWVGLRPLVSEAVTDEQLTAAVQVEMAYYRDHASEGRDEESLAELRERCAAVLSDAIGDEVVTAGELVGAIRVRPFPDALPALESLRDRGLKLICISNWDISLAEVLDGCGLLDHLDEIVSSARVGVPKPDPAPFELGLDLASCDPADALHVGDSLEEDIAGASTVGIDSLLLNRDASVPPGEVPAGVGVITSLDEVESHLGDESR